MGFDLKAKNFSLGKVSEQAYYVDKKHIKEA